MTKGPPAQLDEVDIGIDFGIFKLDTKWVNDPRQQDAAWALAVELLTRVATQEIALDMGALREALTSLHALFDVTRDVLRASGPVVGVRESTVGGIALTVLNKAVRPFLAKWHPALLAWEEQRPQGTGALAHERAWGESVRFRGELKTLQAGLWQYAKSLAQIAGAA